MNIWWGRASTSYFEGRKLGRKFCKLPSDWCWSNYLMLIPSNLSHILKLFRLFATVTMVDWTFVFDWLWKASKLLLSPKRYLKRFRHFISTKNIQRKYWWGERRNEKSEKSIYRGNLFYPCSKINGNVLNSDLAQSLRVTVFGHGTKFAKIFTRYLRPLSSI